jgi:CrcB protein
MSVAVVIAVLVAGAAGALLRYVVALAFAGRSGFPSAVLVVNTLGSALSGALLALTALSTIPTHLDLILVTGLCGGLTTFSTWTVETMQLVLEGRLGSALSNIWLNLMLGLAAATLCFFAVLVIGR